MKRKFISMLVCGMALMLSAIYHPIDVNAASDANGLYDLVWADTGMSFAQANSNSSGSLKALFEIRDGNNNDNLKGTVADTSTNNKLILKNTSVQNLNALNVPESGQLTLNGKKYSYDGWSATLDADGKITEMEFNLTTESTLTDDQLANAIGNTASDGVSYDSKGIVYYQQQMNEFLRNFAEMFNSIEKDGQTLDGEQMGTFFQGETTTGTLYNFNGAYVDSEGKYVSATTNADGSITKNPITKVTSDMDSYYKLTTANIRVNNKSLTDPKYFATTTDITKGTDAYDLVEKLKSLQSDVTMFRGDKASSFLETLLSDVTVDVDKTKTFYNNYNNLASSVDTHRTSISGVDEDEEAMNLIKFQNAYNLAAKTISVMAEMYDKLMNYENAIHEKNQKRIRIGIKCIWIIPLVFLTMLFITSLYSRFSLNSAVIYTLSFSAENSNGISVSFSKSVKFSSFRVCGAADSPKLTVIFSTFFIDSSFYLLQNGLHSFE